MVWNARAIGLSNGLSLDSALQVFSPFVPPAESVPGRISLGLAWYAASLSAAPGGSLARLNLKSPTSQAGRGGAVHWHTVQQSARNPTTPLQLDMTHAVTCQ